MQRFSRDQFLFLEFQTDLLEMMPEKSFTLPKNDHEKELIENLGEYGLFKRRKEGCKRKGENVQMEKDFCSKLRPSFVKGRYIGGP